MSKPDPILALLIEILDHAFDKASWHGANLTGALRGVDAKLAARSIPGRKSIWQQALHAAYWKQRALNKLGHPTRFPRPGSNWPLPSSPPTESAWQADLALLRQTHARLHAAVASLSPAQLRDQKLRRLIHGVAFHDIYHAGQIKLLRRMLGGSA